MFFGIRFPFETDRLARFPFSKYLFIFSFKLFLVVVKAEILDCTMIKHPINIFEIRSNVPVHFLKTQNVHNSPFIKKRHKRKDASNPLNFYFINYKKKLKNYTKAQNSRSFSTYYVNGEQRNKNLGEEKECTQMDNGHQNGKGSECKMSPMSDYRSGYTNDIKNSNENNCTDSGKNGGKYCPEKSGEYCSENDAQNLKQTCNNASEGEEKILYLISPRGFCKGVSRAIETVEECLKLFKTKIYVKHKIVHNDIVCKNLEKKGAIFIEDLNDVPDGNILIYSAHGISPQIREIAKKKNLIEIDATCPLVNKVHVYVQVKAKEGYKIILIGHKNHVEVVGTYNEAPDCTYIVENVNDVENLNFLEKQKLFYVTQTTLSMDDCALIVKKLKDKYPNIETIPSGSICYATTNRQGALIQICPQCDLTIVVGSQSSSNAKKLVYASQIRNVPGVLVNTVDEFDFNLLKNVKRIALTSAASTPEELTQKFVQILTNPPFMYSLKIFNGVQENVPKWKLPKNLLSIMKEKNIRG
ncbi:4-hydroxy-3-methylbut-2-enyl diphosphate reductase [Plasmodium brasilianum]|uniref:4-hydroxy-3-methylbut-2-enyl diphosphate reductase n=2 Tax=Plasmodium (Plasmodium) TaxID=418103 RepID=A0A1A8VPV1_PLAMA|nr:4-hydroxy-3-methylbut-2-enyl diphosphate reductase, putative [Plasmodium malariae]KAI4840946.1 4-hydroxy-3-methylbut-2-enyl diphosphate reductase [Plasmodium brasilianum]SBS81688.1 4-hydroxy-3-methylbut-2-enyl diphosphate reductase, putative (LytB) [Plasmodium malariae]SBT87146.1 4-hydroxy-3-methylbut-2-enyl diphosphate reductase, putative [Plasmodium malariae]